MRPRISVRGSVRPSFLLFVRPSVCWSVCRLVGNQLFFTGRYNKEKMRQPPCLHMQVPFTGLDTFPGMTEPSVKACVAVRAVRRAPRLFG